ncbi:AAA family ATPase [Aliiroseovarius sp.]|uniref:ATP-binding protein n=1 Tax=Aliiroseovarius sp. TaxID=1872442 RepID=UPI0026131667|nr:AAA family ATPase [Aliiroseovarius sp.]
MRLDRLELTRYGKFTDQMVDFGLAKAPDLHVIHGPNEAGKSTLLSAWLDLLFGVPDRSTMNFRHDYKSMQIRAALDIGGRAHHVTRLKKREGSLLDATGSPVGEAFLSGALHGMSRGSYTAMFSLNRQTLEEGGESILASQGDLGELLFQASAGLSDLSAQLAGHDAKTQEFLNRTGRKGQLRELGKDLMELTRRIKELDTQATAFARLVAARDQAETTWRSSRNRLDIASRRSIELERLRNALGPGNHFRRLEAGITGFGNLPDPPADWLREAGALDRAHSDLRARHKAAADRVEALSRDLSRVPDDPEFRALADRIAEAEALKSAHDTAQTDLPKREREREGDAARLADCLFRLGRPGQDPAVLLPDAATMGQLRGLVETHASLHAAHQTARSELLRARTRADQATQRLTDAGGGTTDPGEVRGLVAMLRSEDLRGAADRALTQRDQAETALAKALAALAPWQGQAAELASLRLPDRNTLTRLGERLDAAAQHARAAEAELTRQEQDLATRRATLQKQTPPDGTNAQEAARARAHREATWAAHRASLDPASADRFEQAMRLDDRISATLADRTAKADRAREAAQALAQAEHQASQARGTLEDTRRAHEALREELDGLRLAISPSLPDDMEASHLTDWLDRVAVALDALVIRDDANRALSRAVGQAERARNELLAALDRAGRSLPKDAGLTPALETAQALLDAAARLDTLSDAARQAGDDLSERQHMETEAAAALAEWQEGWSLALQGTAWADPLPEAAEMRAILEELGTLRSLQEKLRELDHRIAAMTENRDRFALAVRDLARDARLDHTLTYSDAWRVLRDRALQARAADTRRGDLQSQLDRARRDLSELDRESASHRARIDQIAAFFSVADWTAARAALAQAEQRAQLKRAQAERADELCEILGTQTEEEALASLEGVDADSISAEIDHLNTELATLRSAQDESHATFREAAAALAAVGGDGEVARLEETRQTCLIEIEEGARAHLRARLGLVAVEDALRRYRDTHRSGMMTRASQAFSTITGGRYSGLTTQADGQRETLVALPAEGGSRQAGQLSEGTRAQLYLALRIAGYHEFVRQNGPVPFIADDIMESFDDERAKATFGLLAAMSGLGQVIYLTHHAHMRDLAQAACAKVRLHELT